MGEDTSQIEQEIRRKRSDLGRNLDELEGKARELADWRTHYRRHTGVALGVAFGAGVVLALTSVPSRRADREPELDDSADIVQIPAERKRAWLRENQTAIRAKHQFGETWDQIADALFKMASGKALEFVSNLVPGIRDHLDGNDAQFPRRVM